MASEEDGTPPAEEHPDVAVEAEARDEEPQSDPLPEVDNSVKAEADTGEERLAEEQVETAQAAPQVEEARDEEPHPDPQPQVEVSVKVEAETGESKVVEEPVDTSQTAPQAAVAEEPQPDAQPQVEDSRTAEAEIGEPKVVNEQVDAAQTAPQPDAAEEESQMKAPPPAAEADSPKAPEDGPPAKEEELLEESEMKAPPPAAEADSPEVPDNGPPAKAESEMKAPPPAAEADSPEVPDSGPPAKEESEMKAPPPAAEADSPEVPDNDPSGSAKEEEESQMKAPPPPAEADIPEVPDNDLPAKEVEEESQVKALPPEAEAEIPEVPDNDPPAEQERPRILPPMQQQLPRTLEADTTARTPKKQKAGSAMNSPFSKSTGSLGITTADMRAKTAMAACTVDGVLKRTTYMSSVSNFPSAPKYSITSRGPSSFFRSSSTPAPGSYNAPVTMKSKFKAPPSFSFGSSARFGLGPSPLKLQPGPGAYEPKDPTMSIEPKVGFGSSKRNRGADTPEPNPGPGAYEVRSTVGDALMFTARGRQPTSYMKAKGQPGPGAYSPKDHYIVTASPKCGFGTSTREELASRTTRLAALPGPGAYELHTYKTVGKDSLKFSATSRRRMHDISSYTTPGPGAYNAHVTTFGDQPWPGAVLP